jgi:SAM-dependent methyltransferase
VSAEKYDELADGFTEREYGDPARYFGHRAEIVVALGPRLEPGDLVVDVACADGSFAPPLLDRGLRYLGVDLNERMVAAARRRVGGRARFEQGDMRSHRPQEAGAAVVCFRSLHFVDDRPAFFRHLASFAEKKVVFDADPRRYPPKRIRADLAAAGLGEVALHPFFVPQHAALPAAAARLLAAAEGIEPLARAVLRRRFNVIVSAWR